MIEVSQCVICEGAIHRLKRALVAPFMARRIWNRTPFCVDLVECEACGFIFYNPRLDDADLHRLYAGYRSEEYQRMRQASEPWYTPKFNIDLASPASYAFRRSLLLPILKQHIGTRKIDRILDYGGDRGDLVVDLFEGAQAFVYDISQIPAAQGVTSISDPAACNADLIINSNVLEHVGFPRTLVADMLKAAPEGGLVFIEAPREDPFGMGRVLRRIAQIGVISVLHPSLAPFLVRPASLYMMHEHVNSFTEQTLTTLMRSCGGTVTAAGSYPSSGRAGKGDMLWCMGMKPAASQSN